MKRFCSTSAPLDTLVENIEQRTYNSANEISSLSISKRCFHIKISYFTITSTDQYDKVHIWSAENDIFVKKTLKLGAVFIM